MKIILMGRCNKTHKTSAESLACVDCMKHAQVLHNVLNKAELDRISSIEETLSTRRDWEPEDYQDFYECDVPFLLGIIKRLGDL